LRSIIGAAADDQRIWNEERLRGVGEAAAEPDRENTAAGKNTAAALTT